jgi:hypothetical protein
MTTLRSVDDITGDILKAEDGGTFPVVVGQRVPVVGYVVGQHGISGPADTLDVRGWVERVRTEVAHKPCHFVGSWSADGLLYLDVVKVYSELRPALKDARERGELAIYDLAEGETLYVERDAVVPAVAA